MPTASVNIQGIGPFTYIVSTVGCVTINSATDINGNTASTTAGSLQGNQLPGSGLFQDQLNLLFVCANVCQVEGEITVVITDQGTAGYQDGPCEETKFVIACPDTPCTLAATVDYNCRGGGFIFGFSGNVGNVTYTWDGPGNAPQAGDFLPNGTYNFTFTDEGLSDCTVDRQLIVDCSGTPCNESPFEVTEFQLSN